MVAPVRQQGNLVVRDPQRRTSKCESACKFLKNILKPLVIGAGMFQSYYFLTRECPARIRKVGESMNHDLSSRTFVINEAPFECAKPPCKGKVRIQSNQCAGLLIQRKESELKTALRIYSAARENGGTLPEEFSLNSVAEAFNSDQKTAIELFSQFSAEHPKYGRDLYDSAEKSRKLRGEFMPRPDAEEFISRTICRENANTPYQEVEERDLDKCIMHTVRAALCKTDSISNHDICSAPSGNFTSSDDW